MGDLAGLMATWPEARSAKLNRQDREAAEKRRRHRTRPGPACPRCGQPTAAVLVERTGDPVHPACYTVDDDPIDVGSRHASSSA